MVALSALAAAIAVGLTWLMRRGRLPTEVSSGPLIGRPRDTLAGAIAILLGVEVDLTHYLDFFSSRAEMLPGHLGLYQRAASRLDEAARARGGPDFLGSDGAIRRDVTLSTLGYSPGDEQRERKAWLAIVHPETRLFQRHITAAALELFADTDRYVLLGYPAWPGVPIGYDPHHRTAADLTRASVAPPAELER
jgi:hypothetical protein